MKHLMIAICLCLCGGISLAKTVTWKAAPSGASWTDGRNFEEGEAPVVGDTVVVPAGVTAILADGDEASIGVATNLTKISLPTRTSILEVSVIGDVTFGGSIAGVDWHEESQGTLVKRGAGALRFGKGDAGAYNYMEIDVREGTLYLQQNVSASCFFKRIRIAEGATVYGVRSYRTFVDSLTGDGTFRTVANGEVVTQGGTAESPVVCNVLFADCSLYQGGHYVFANRANRLSKVTTYNKGVTAVPTFVVANGESPLGGSDTLYFAEAGGGTYRFLGDAPETCPRSFTAYSGAQGPSVIDAGSHGGLTLTGTWSMGGWRDGMTQIVLTGSNAVESVFDGKVGGKPGLSFAFAKSGSGTWRLGATGDRTAMASSLLVEEGRLRYDTVMERGDPCSLGLATNTLAPYCGAYDASRKVDYAALLGKPGLAWPASNLATLDYSGTARRGVTTRPLALQGDAAVMSSAAKLVYRGASPVVEGVSRLVLKGDAMDFTNVFADVTDGADPAMRMGVVKDGAGTWTLTGTNSFSGPLIVNGGTLVARRPTSRYEWFRLIVKDSYGCLTAGYDFYKLGRVAFMNAQGIRLSCGLTPVSDCTTAASRAAYWNEPQSGVLEPGEFGWGAPVRTAAWEGAAMANLVKVGECWDSSCHTFARSSVKTAYADAPSKWLFYDFRLPSDSEPVCYYDMALVYGLNAGATSNYAVRAWALMGSTDGIHWDELHEVADARSDDPDQKMRQRKTASTWMGSDIATTSAQGADFAFDTAKLQEIPSEDPQAASIPFLERVEYVSVAPGATLAVEGDVVFSAFRVDATQKGCGTVYGARLAETCTVEVENLPKGAVNIDLPLRFEGFTGFPAWRIRADGCDRGRYAVAIRNGRMHLSTKGLCVVFR